MWGVVVEMMRTVDSDVPVIEQKSGIQIDTEEMKLIKLVASL